MVRLWAASLAAQLVLTRVVWLVDRLAGQLAARKDWQWVASWAVWLDD